MGVEADQVRARRAAQARALLDRYRRIRAATPRRTDDPGVGDELLAEMAEFAPLRAKVNRMELGDWGDDGG